MTKMRLMPIIDAHNRLLQTLELTFQLNLMHIKGNNKQKRLNSREKNYGQNQNNLHALTWGTKISGTNTIGGI